MFDALNALVYIAGWAALTPVLLFVAAIVLCNAWDFGQAMWRKLMCSCDALSDWCDE